MYIFFTNKQIAKYKNSKIAINKFSKNYDSRNNFFRFDNTYVFVSIVYPCGFLHIPYQPELP